MRLIDRAKITMIFRIIQTTISTLLEPELVKKGISTAPQMDLMQSKRKVSCKIMIFSEYSCTVGSSRKESA